ncbi:hypothetical protein ABTK51_20100, partial [Acinetobacter baumannii]
HERKLVLKVEVHGSKKWNLEEDEHVAPLGLSPQQRRRFNHDTNHPTLWQPQSFCSGIQCDLTMSLGVDPGLTAWASDD